jgi:hypothetical protein
MTCPHCRQDILDSANFCHHCGAALKPPAQPGFQGRLVRPGLKWLPQHRNFIIFIAGFLVLIGTGYFVFFVARADFNVELQNVTDSEALAFLTQATFEEYCKQFQNECSAGNDARLQMDIRKTLEKIASPAKPEMGYIKIIYSNSGIQPVTLTKLMARQKEGPWATLTYRGETLLMQQFPLALAMTRGNLPFLYKVRFALAKSTLSHSALLTIPPGDRKVWVIVNKEIASEFQAEYKKNRDEKTHLTPVLYVRG